MVGNGNRDIRGERQKSRGVSRQEEGQKAGRYLYKTRETVQSQNTMIKQRKNWECSEMSAVAKPRLCDECVWSCGLSSPQRMSIRWTSNQCLVQDDGKWRFEREVNLGWWCDLCERSGGSTGGRICYRALHPASGSWRERQPTASGKNLLNLICLLTIDDDGRGTLVPGLV